MTIYASTQMPHLHRAARRPGARDAARGRVAVKAPDVGGAFGLKCTMYPEDLVIPAVARGSAAR